MGRADRYWIPVLERLWELVIIVLIEIRYWEKRYIIVVLLTDYLIYEDFSLVWAMAPETKRMNISPFWNRDIHQMELPSGNSGSLVHIKR